ncbi:hypothetical protein [Streptomyces sp. NPDC088725]|uniref:hypothetical protein n=1 Tax=Streptomyces sp. NPDC088725 TaxID=3365873 RepID=UPI0038040633
MRTAESLTGSGPVTADGAASGSSQIAAGAATRAAAAVGGLRPLRRRASGAQDS